MKLELDNEMMKGLVSEALLRSLDEGQRNTLIKGAIEHLLAPQNGDFHRKGTSPMESAFRYACENAARTIINEEMTKDETFKTKIRELFSAALIRVMETDREQSIGKLAAAITDALVRRRD